MKYRKIKQALLGKRGLVRGRRNVSTVNVLVCMYDRTLKPVEIILYSRERVRESDGGDVTKVQCKHIWKCAMKLPVSLIYANEMF
jgi:hypothetical protein